ncbi:MAG: putative molybdenum carrier protein [Candidatus Udaeobacter sp.]
MKALKIISGGQTGVDRAALDVALGHGINCGGWCPTGRLDEFGKIPDYYPIRELPGGSFTERTLQNVKDSDGTVVVYCDHLRGGTAQTVYFCLQLKRPHELIDASKISAEGAAKLIGDFIDKNKINILNVAGPRQSEWPEGYAYASRALSAFLYNINRTAALLPDRGARRSTRGSAPRTNRLRRR